MPQKSFETPLPVIPEGGEMIWRFTKTKTSDGDIMLQFHCNDKEMLNVKLDEKTCDSRYYKDNGWKKYWGADVEKVMFAYNSNIDYFRAYKGEPLTISRWITNDMHPFLEVTSAFKFQMKAHYK